MPTRCDTCVTDWSREVALTSSAHKESVKSLLSAGPVPTMSKSIRYLPRSGIVMLPP